MHVDKLDVSPRPGSWCHRSFKHRAESQMPFCGYGQPQEEAHTQGPAYAQTLGNCPREVGDWPFITHASRAQQGLAQACTPCMPLLPPLWLLSVSPRRTVLSLGLVPPVCMSVLCLTTPSPPAFLPAVPTQSTTLHPTAVAAILGAWGGFPLLGKSDRVCWSGAEKKSTLLLHPL